MAKKWVRLPSITRVGAGNKALLEIPVGPTYERIRFVASGTSLTVAMIQKIELLMNGTTKQSFANLQRLIDLNSFYNRSADSATDFMMHFFSKEFDSPEWKLNPRIGTKDLDTFTIEILLDATWPANGTLKAEAFIDTEAQAVGVFTVIREYPYSSATAGLVEVDKLPKNGALYKAIHLYKPDIDKVELEVAGTKVVDADKASLERFQKDAVPFARVPVSPRCTHIDFLLNGLPGDMLNTIGVNDMRLKMNLVTAGNVDIQVEMLETL